MSRIPYTTFLDRVKSICGDWPEASELIGFLGDPHVQNGLECSPASTAHRFHHANPGDLLVHVWEMLATGQILLGALDPINDLETTSKREYTFFSSTKLAGKIRSVDFAMAVCLHDIHKIGDCDKLARFLPHILTKGQRSEAIPWVTSDIVNQFHKGTTDTPMGHAARWILKRNPDLIPDGELSLALIAGLRPSLLQVMNEDVLFAIRHHDGYYGAARRDLRGNETPLQMVLHFLDMWSSRLNSRAYKTG